MKIHVSKPQRLFTFKLATIKWKICPYMRLTDGFTEYHEEN